MRRRLSHPVLALALLVGLAALAGCQSPDVGQACPIAWGSDPNNPAPTPTSLYASGGSDYFDSGNLACDGLVCILSPAPQGTKYGDYASGYCSKPCVSNDDCYESKTSLVCRQIVLDPVFLQTLDPATKARYLSDIQFSSYCAIPR